MVFLDTTTWVAVGAAIGSAALALALGATLIVVLVRARRREEPQIDVARMLRDSDERFERTLEDVSGKLRQARDDLRRSHRVSALASTIDLDVLSERILEAALGLEGVDAGALSVPRLDEEPLIATAGLTAEEAKRQALPTDPEAGAGAVTIVYRYPEDDADPARIGGGLAVPLDGADAPVGMLAVFWRGRSRELSEADVAALEELAADAGRAVENAIRFRDASRLADLDALTGLQNRRYFHDTLARECARAGRYERELALLVLDVDNFKAINDRIGHLAADAVLAQLAERVRSVVRTSDIACRIGGDEFAVILPESNLEDAEQLYRRLQFAIENAAAGPVERLQISAGVAKLEGEADPVAFFEQADEALYRAKQNGKSRAEPAQNGV